MSLIIRGAHPVEAPEPCHLVEVELIDEDGIDWGAITQEVPDQPMSNWQVPWDERPVNTEGSRWGFFFHYLDFTRPLLTPRGEIRLPNPTPMPAHSQGIQNEPPC
jgi:hypothetical protein